MLKISTKKFDPQNWPEGVWGDYAPGVRLKIRKLTGDAVRELRKPYVRMEMEVEKTSRRMVPVEKVSDEEAYNNALLDYLIEDFVGLGDEKGVPLPVTLDSKKAISNNLPLWDWVWAFAQSQEIVAEEQHQAEIKN